MGRLLVMLCLSASGCGDDGDRGRADADVPGSSGCLLGAHDASGAWPFTPGAYAIAGTITFPAMVPAGRAVQLETVKVSPFPGGNHLAPATLGTDKTAITYRAYGLPDGSWKICLRVDVDGNGMVGDVGVDYIGCYDGTAAMPIKTSGAATEIMLGSMCQPDKDFGVGVQ